MSQTLDESCGCPPAPHPAAPEIPAGLTTLAARQSAGFPEFREAMLAAIPGKSTLADWRARGAGDLGVMTLEAWAYVLDVTGFYDARIAERAYLPTAPDDAAARRLTALLGHRPRPAMAARVQLAVEADGADPVLLPKGTAFRSAPFDGEPPQVFELPAETLIWPRRNRWRLAPLREDVFDGTLRFLPRRAPSAGAVVVIWNDTAAVAARVLAVEPEPSPDGLTYQRAVLDADSTAAVAALAGTALSGLQVSILRLPLAESAFVTPPSTTTSFSTVTLDGLYPQVRPGARAVVELGTTLHPVTIFTAWRATLTVDATTGATVPATQVTLSKILTRGVNEAFTLHVNPFDLGAPTRPARTSIALADIQAGAALRPPVAPLGEAPASGKTILLGVRKQGELLPGALVDEGNDAARFQPDATLAEFAAPLDTPLALWGNIVEAVRGETVTDEPLGSGNAARPFNSFTLKKKPLAWVEDASQPSGRRPELTVRVDNVEWARAETFFGRDPEERVYVVRAEVDGSTRITFGDGLRGARPPTGVGNIRADYRFGAGAAKPPPGAVNQIAVPVRGLAAVRGPLPATGGADAERAEELRRSAPAAALTLGRAVSLADFEALARSFPGVINAASAWAWDERRQRAAAKLWIIADGGDPGDDLRAWLAAQAVPDLIIVVETAGTAVSTTLAVTLEFATGHDPQLVAAAAWSALFDPATGLLAPANQRIGGALFRSALMLRLHQVAGVMSVVSVLLDGLPMPAAVGPGQGNWFDLAAGATVG